MTEFSVPLLLAGTFSLSAPLVLAAMGGLTSERSGVMNIALEGKMLTAACVTAMVAVATGNALLALLAGVGAAVIVSLAHLLFTQAFGMDHIISGMAINLVAAGGTSLVAKAYLSRQQVGDIAQIPFWLFFVAAYGAPLLLAFYLRFTRGGLRLLAVGNDPDKARQMGIDPLRVRLPALLTTGVLCGLAGAMLASNAGRFTDGMTAGKGYIALAALILGGWRPLPALVACVAFGAFEALQLQLQGTTLLGAGLPSEVWNALPYAVTLVALAGFLGRSRSPAGMGKA